MSNRYNDLKDAFLRARNLSDHERNAFLEALAARDMELCDSVEQLLSAHAAGTVIETIEDVERVSQRQIEGDQSSDHIYIQTRPSEQPGDDVFPGYSILKRISEGGQGVVYQAVQQETKRKVAIKVLLAGIHASKKAQARFEREIELAARLSHPHIVSIFHAGTATDGRSFFVMDYIRGLPLTAYVRGNTLSLDDSLVLFGKVCEAVQYAHQRGIIHRDLKPTNILVDADGNPKILDFGLAKLIGGPEETAATLSQQVMGTLPYMSPEQTRGNPDEIDTRTDVYALGVILYELLTGHYPYPVTGHMAEVLKHIAETEPTPPSRAWKPDSGVHLGKTSSRMGRSASSPIDDEIQTIVLKSLSKERERRYQSAGELARDVKRYLANDPIEAKRDSAWYVFRKAARRYRVPFAVASSFVLLLAAATITTVILWRQTAQQRDIAETEWRRAEDAEAEAWQREQEATAARDNLKKVSEFQASMLADVDPEKMGIQLRHDLLTEAKDAMEQSRFEESQVSKRLEQVEYLLAGTNFTNIARNAIDDQVLEPAVVASERDFADQPLVRAQLQQTLGRSYRQIGLFEAALPLHQSALETRRHLLGNEHQDTLTSIRGMGGLLLAMGNLPEAEAYTRESLDLRRRVFGDDHRETIASINDVGNLFLTREQLDQAEEFVREAVMRGRRVLGDDDPVTIESMNTLGYLLLSTGNNFESEYYLSEALRNAKRKLGEDHETTQNILSNLASALKHVNRIGEARQLFEETLRVRRHTLGDAHPRTLIALNNLGALHYATGKLSEAEPYVREALQIRRQVLGDRHPNTLRSIHNMGALLKWMGKTRESIPYHREALKGERVIFGDNSPRTIMAMISLAYLLRTTKEYSEAESVIREALIQSRRVHGDVHPNTGTSLLILGSVLRSMGRLTEGELYLREALGFYRRQFGLANQDTLASLENLGYLLQESRRLPEAEHLFRTAAETARRHFANSPDLLGVYLHSLGRCMGAQRKFFEAEAALLESHEVLEQALGPKHESVATAIESLVELYGLWASKEFSDDAEQKAREWRKKLSEKRQSE